MNDAEWLNSDAPLAPPCASRPVHPPWGDMVAGAIFLKGQPAKGWCDCGTLQRHGRRPLTLWRKVVSR